MKFEEISWEKVEELCYDIKEQMDNSNYVPDAIIGLLRGGVVPARIFADYFNITLDFFALDVKLYDGIGKRKEKPIIRYAFKDNDIDGKRILVVDDIYDSGTTMNAVLEHLKGKNVTTTTLHWKETANQKPDYFAEIAYKGQWYCYPWEKHETKREIQKG